MSTAPSPDPPDDRLDRIEARLARLERAVAALHEAASDGGEEALEDEPPAAASSSAPSAPAADGEARTDATPGLIERGRRAVAQVGLRSEEWLSYVGVGLLLFGLAFLFKYSIEQGWLVPTVRVGFGAVTGTLLLAGGLRIYAQQRRLRQVLLGGSSAVFYGTVFAAYQLYGLLAYPLAFGAMGAITVWSIALALREDEAVLAVVGTAGGLGTPFLLYTEAGSVGGIAGYTWLVLAGACAVYLYRGWRSLLAVAVSGGWLVLLIPCLEAGFGGDLPEGAWGLQAGLAGAWVLLGGTPVLRAVLRHREPTRWGQPAAPGWMERLLSGRPAYGVVTASPLLALLGSRLLWGGPDATWALLAGIGALGYVAAYEALRRVPMPHYAPAHGLVAALLTTYGLSEAVGGATLLLVWGVEAALLLVLATRLEEATLRWVGRVLFGVVGLWLAERLADPARREASPLAPEALSELGVGVLLLAAGRWGASGWEKWSYQGGALAVWLAWWPGVLAALSNGAVYVSAVWATTAAGLLVLGAWRRVPAVQWAGLATLALFVGKLFLVDLATVPALWRIALFLGAGGGFLLVSYALPQVGLGGADADG